MPAVRAPVNGIDLVRVAGKVLLKLAVCTDHTLMVESLEPLA
eukprot:CAMPEP_0119066124 /NCGR_PEP_ID=MMETSP1178-20130426/8771_1 /TAXON_ID=33656 /ORGANISM="unid sp, Strain CCMP2000" /LENGTH=41 /DNA_ID= /DNA_START= /DNA_END= /DNA_ORIENTATION=